MNTDIKHEDNVTTVAVSGSVDALTAPDLARAIVDEIAEGHVYLVIDLFQSFFVFSIHSGSENPIAMAVAYRLPPLHPTIISKWMFSFSSTFHRPSAAAHLTEPAPITSAIFFFLVTINY